MPRPVCDPIDIPAAIAGLDKGVSVSALYWEYASTAARPYASKTFYQIVTAAKNKKTLKPSYHVKPQIIQQQEDWQLDEASDNYWLRFLNAKPDILTTVNDNTSLRVKGDALEIYDGTTRLIYEKSSRKPQAIVMTGYSGVVSVEAMRFAHDNGIAIVLLDWSRDFLSIVAPPAIQSANLIRAQASANPLPIAKEIVCQKLTAYVRVGGLTREDAARRIEAVAQARSIQAVMTQEAQGARFAWQHSIPSIIWRSSPVSVPRAWKLPYSTRGRDGSPRDAVQPVNALLNVCSFME